VHIFSSQRKQKLHAMRTCSCPVAAAIDENNAMSNNMFSHRYSVYISVKQVGRPLDNTRTIR